MLGIALAIGISGFLPIWREPETGQGVSFYYYLWRGIQGREHETIDEAIENCEENYLCRRFYHF
jgi:hypothetical protein